MTRQVSSKSKKGSLTSRDEHDKTSGSAASADESGEGIGMNVKSVIVVALLMMLMLFSVHCTWVTSNAYSSPSIVLASYGNDG